VTSTLAVDLGGTNMRAALVDGIGTVSARAERDTPKTAALDALRELVREVLDAGDAASAVIGVPGRVDYGAGRLEYAPNLSPHCVELLTEAALANELGLDVALANDADLAAVGEAWFGAGREHADVAYLTISTGIGAGVVTGGLLVHGRRSVAEVGHTIVDGRALLEGTRATVEQLGSGTALTALAQEAEIAPDGPALVELVRAGDATAARIFERVVYAAAIGAVNLAHLFTPDVIVIGGGLGLVGELVLEPIRALVHRRGPRALPNPIVVCNAELGDDAGLAGGGAWTRAFTPQAAGRVPRPAED
jgi:glucokinase